MANSLVTIDMVTREALRVAHESCQFIATTDRQYDDSFAKTGAKIGSSLRVRKPNQYLRTQGSRVMDVQEQDEQTGTVTVATQDHVDMRFNSAELALSLDELSKRYIEPAVKTLVSGIEADYLAFASKATYQLVGTDNTAITTLEVPGKARAKLNQQLAPKSERAIQMDSVTMGALVNGMSAYFNPSNAIGEQYVPVSKVWVELFTDLPQRALLVERLVVGLRDRVVDNWGRSVAVPIRARFV